MSASSARPNGEVYIVSAVRTPIGKFGGALSAVPATELGGVAIRAAVERAGLGPATVAVDDVLMGQVLQAGVGQAPARQAAIRAGLPDSTSATTINRVCGSGLKSIMLAASEIRAGDAELVIAGGMESMNGAPYVLPGARFGLRLGDTPLVDSAVNDGLWCAIEGCHMGTHAERVAISAHVSREDQDAFALASHRKAIAAIDAGRFDAEMAPVTVRDAKGRETIVTEDENPRRDSTAEALARLKPVFALPEGDDRGEATVGTVTAGNAPGITDGAAATLVASERAVERLGLKPLARIVGYAQAEVAPKWLFLAPIEGVRRLLERVELPLDAFDLIEINEAFAAQTLADGRALGFDWDRVNVNGGAIALGHPIGASGARIVATLLHELQRREGRYGLATLCLGGGGSVAMALERA
ncbi:MAG: acetyl-CoA C-acetyltransferase [Chloroflexota bacterium]|jgi:acetyl-CoA C-acetyltransferase|nr:acetyl-CoA C-acetyltransferase [Chloroflexota bacterium]MDH5243013.1 acetyl-CoA C-acetyltransferase [Chloroflexota bacterium]